MCFEDIHLSFSRRFCPSINYYHYINQLHRLSFVMIENRFYIFMLTQKIVAKSFRRNLCRSCQRQRDVGCKLKHADMPWCHFLNPPLLCPADAMLDTCLVHFKHKGDIIASQQTTIEFISNSKKPSKCKCVEGRRDSIRERLQLTSSSQIYGRIF